MADRRWTAAVASAVASAALLLLPSPADAASTTSAPLAAGTQTSTQVPRPQSALELQRRLQESRAAHSRAVRRLQLLERHLATRTEQADRAARVAAGMAAQIDGSSGVVDAVSDWASGDGELERVQGAMREAEHLREIATIAEQGVARARGDVRDTARAHLQARSAAKRLEMSTAARASAQLAQDWSTLAPDYRASTSEQDARNRHALDAWRRQLSAMADAGVAPPPADLLERRRLPDGLRPASDELGRAIPGAAVARGRQGAAFEVVPDVTVRAVSAAFASLGVVPGDERSCAEFVHDVWDTAQVDVPADSVSLWQSVTAAAERQVVVGDVIFFRRDDGHGIGISVGEGSVVAIDPSSAEVAVVDLGPSDLLAVRRVTLSADRGARVADVPSLVAQGCEPPAPEPPPAEPDPQLVVSSGGFVLPVAEGSYSVSAAFGVGGRLWSSGSHTGQDFAAPLGTPVMAAAAGQVTVEQASWAGQLVRVDHGGGVETWYAHMSRVDVSTGDTVEAGSPVGAVGSEGNSTGPHLHFEVRVDGEAVDPMAWLAGRPTP